MGDEEGMFRTAVSFRGPFGVKNRRFYLVFKIWQEAAAAASSSSKQQQHAVKKSLRPHGGSKPASK